MPRRYYDYDPQFFIWHHMSTWGSYLQAVGFVVAGYCLFQSLLKGKPAPANPWGGNSLEWHCQSPPIHENFMDVPDVEDCYDFTDWKYDREVGGYVLKG